MLSWSGTETGQSIDLRAPGLSAVPHAAALERFAAAAVGIDDAVLTAARTELEHQVGRAAMIDAAAVVANFEMLTRTVDGTGGRHPEAGQQANEAIVVNLGLEGLTSRR
jgi:hypothetical protein